MKILTFTEGGKTIYINAAMIVSFTAQGAGTYISMIDSVNIEVDQTPAEVLAAITAA